MEIYNQTKITVDNTVNSDKNNTNSERDAMLSLLNKEEKAASIKRLKNLSEKQNHENIIGNEYQVTLDGHQFR